MTLLSRPPKCVAVLPVAVLIASLIYLWTSDWRARRQTEPIASSLTQHNFVEDSHKLLTADSFLPHFEAVLKTKGMTVTEAKEDCNWFWTEKVNFQYTWDTDWAIEEKCEKEIAKHRAEWQDFIWSGLQSYKTFQHRFEGRGVVVVAGENTSMKRLRVLLRALAKTGSQLPLEVHYWADELNDEEKKNVSSLWPNISFNDLSSSTNIIQTHPGPANYQFKTAAVLNSRFAEVFLLDSDNVPIIDPAELFESPTYQEYGTIFWPDIARTRNNNPAWAITNTKCRKDEWEQESGQLLVDKRKFFYHLQLAAWINNKQTFYYSTFLLGDKDLFRFAWHALKTKFGTPKRWVTSVGTLVGDYYCGHTFAQHHPDDGRVAFMHGGLVKTLALEVIRWHQETKGGIYQVYKRSDDDENHSLTIDTEIKYDFAEYLPNKTGQVSHVASCVDMAEVVARPLEELIPGFQEKFDEIGGYWMLGEVDWDEY